MNKKINSVNFNDPLMKVLRIVNSISGRSLTEADLKRHRAAMETAGKIAAPRGDVAIKEFRAGDISCEEIRPELAHDPRYAILYAHGGGYVSGNLSYARILAAKLAISTGFTVFTFDYRLAPEHPYPASLEDALTVYSNLTEERYRPDHVLLAGESAGGNLALCMVQKLIGDGRKIPAQILLFSPWTDMTASAASYEECADRDPILTGDYIKEVAEAYIGSAGCADDARFSPLFGSFASFPPVYIMTGKNEILFDDSSRLFDKIILAGSEAVLDIEENGWHVYQQMPVPIAHRAMKRLSAYVSGRIYGGNDE